MIDDYRLSDQLHIYLYREKKHDYTFEKFSTENKTEKYIVVTTSPSSPTVKNYIKIHISNLQILKFYGKGLQSSSQYLISI